MLVVEVEIVVLVNQLYFRTFGYVGALDMHLVCKFKK